MNLQFPEQFDYVAKDFQEKGVWEPKTTEYLRKNLKKGQVFVDVGAHVGYYSILAAECEAKVIAFEPSAENRALLIQNLTANKAVCDVLDVALAEKEGDRSLYTGRTPGENSLVVETEKRETVHCMPYDALGLPVPDMIKIDIEGAEKEALLGMQSILQTEKPITIILEDWYNKVTDWLIDEHGFQLVTTERAYGNRILVKNQPCIPEEEPLRVHLLGTFNTPTTLADEGIANAFASKTVRMAKILKSLGAYVIFYGVEGSEVECDEFVQCSTKAVLEQEYGKWDSTKVYGCVRDGIAHRTFNDNAIREIRQRKLFGDFLLCSFGTYQKPIADAVQIPDTIEIGIGYTGSFARFRIFESAFMQNWTYGTEERGDGNFYDTVIPGYFDPADFTYAEKKDGYFLYLGRIITRKGVMIARDACAKMGKKLVVAGFGLDAMENPVDAQCFADLVASPNVEYVGFAGKEKRKELLAKAQAVFMPTTYLEPFGYVALEAAFSGTPVITTDFGAFPETVEHGVTGFRCSTFADFCTAIARIDAIRPQECRKRAERLYTLEAAATLYKAYFRRILGLYGKGWYAM